MALLGTVLLTLDHAAPAAVSANATPIAIGAQALIGSRECLSFHSVNRLGGRHVALQVKDVCRSAHAGSGVESPGSLLRAGRSPPLQLRPAITAP